MPKQKRKESRINVRAPENEKEELKKTAERAGLTESHIVRQTVKKGIADINRQLDEGVTVVTI